jgi:hypothetical protein
MRLGRRSLVPALGATVACVAVLFWVGSIGWAVLAIIAFLMVPGVILGYAGRQLPLWLSGLLYSIVIAAIFWPIGPVIFLCGLIPFAIQGYRTAAH